MWFKTPLSVYYSALLVVECASATDKYDGALFRRRYPSPPVLWRRGQSFQNATTLPETLEATSETQLASTTHADVSSYSLTVIFSTTESSITNDGYEYTSSSSLWSSTMSSIIVTPSGVGISLTTTISTPTPPWKTEISTSTSDIHVTASPPGSPEDYSISSSQAMQSTFQSIQLHGSSESAQPPPSNVPSATLSKTEVPSIILPSSQLSEPTRTTFAKTADNQLVTPTPSPQAQPITFSSTVISHNEVTTSQLNTVAEQTTQWHFVPIPPQSITSGSAISDTSASDILASSRIEQSFSNTFVYSTVATGYDSTLSASLIPTYIPLPATSSPTSEGLSSSVAREITIIPTSASASTNASGHDIATQSSNTTRLILPMQSTMNAESRSGNISTILPTITTEYNTTSTISSQNGPKTTNAYYAWTNSSTEGASGLVRTLTGSALPSGFINNPKITHSHILQTTLLPTLRNSTFGNFTFLNTTLATITTSINTSTPTNIPNATTLYNSTTVLNDVGHGPTTSLPGAPTITSTATETVVASPPPPLNTPQTAGVAIGSVAGILLAVVAAVFLARRYHAKRVARRRSTGSVYPKVAYLYDPPVDGSWGTGSGEDSTSALMSGGAGGYPSMENMSRTSPQTGDYARRYSTGSMNYFSDPGNPFMGPRDSLPAPAHATMALSATMTGYAIAAQKSPTTDDYPALEVFRDLDFPSPTVSPPMANGSIRHNHRRSISQHSAHSGQTVMSCPSYIYPTGINMDYAPLSPYRNQLNQSLASVQEVSNLDPFAEPLEDDLYLPIDPKTETPESVLVYAPPPTPRTPVKPSSRSTSATGNTSSTSLVSSIAPHSPPKGLNRLAPQASFTSNSTLSEPERFSLAYDKQSSTTYIRPTKSSRDTLHSDSSVSPISSPPPPVHRGWEDIKRFSSESSVPSPLFTPPPLSFSPPPPNLSPPPVKKRSLIQLRRKEPALAGTGHIMMSSTGQPLTVKIPFKYNPSSGFEGPRMSLLAKMNTMGDEQDDHIRSPGLSITESQYSVDSTIQRKRSEHFVKPGTNAKIVQIGH